MFKHLIIVPVLLLAVSATAQPITFQKTIGGPNDEVAYSVQQTADGGYVLAGYTKSYGPGSFENAYLVKTDSLGDVNWTKTYGVAGGASKARCARQTSDGGYILAGYIYQSAATGYDVLLVKTDANGNAQWTKTIGGAGADSAVSIELTTDGGYIISCTSSSSGTGDDVYLVKTDAVGNVTWANTIVGGAILSEGTKQSADGGYFTTFTGNTFQALILAKSNANGNLMWQKIYYSNTHPGNNHRFACNLGTDGGYVLSSRGGTAGGNDIGLIKANTSGDIIWSKNYGNSADDIGLALHQTAQGHIIVAGASYSFGTGDADVYLLKTDSIGNLKWSNSFGGGGEDIGYAMQQTADGGFVIAGSTKSFGGNSQLYLIKTDSMGASDCNHKTSITLVNPGISFLANVNYGSDSGGVATNFTVNTVAGGTDSTLCSSITKIIDASRRVPVAVYPNPADNLLTIEYTKAGSFQFTDMLGRVVASRVMEGAQNNITINTSLFPSGVYVYRITDKAGRQQAGKVVIAH